MGGKVTRLRSDMLDVNNMVEILNVLKDVATNRFLTAAQERKNVDEYLNELESVFLELKSIETTSPFIHAGNAGTDILIVGSDANFVGQLNAHVTQAAIEEVQESGSANIICIGRKAAERLSQMNVKVEEVFLLNDFKDHQTCAAKVRDLLVKRLLEKKTSKIKLVMDWAQNLSNVKTKKVTLLPVPQSKEKSAAESDPKKSKMILEDSIELTSQTLAELLCYTRIYEALQELELAEFATQACQLESALEGMAGEAKVIKFQLRKAIRERLNQTLREVFTQSKMLKEKKIKAAKKKAMAA